MLGPVTIMSGLQLVTGVTVTLNVFAVAFGVKEKRNCPLKGSSARIGIPGKIAKEISW